MEIIPSPIAKRDLVAKHCLKQTNFIYGKASQLLYAASPFFLGFYLVRKIGSSLQVTIPNGF